MVCNTDVDLKDNSVKNPDETKKWKLIASGTYSKSDVSQLWAAHTNINIDSAHEILPFFQMLQMAIPRLYQWLCA